MKRAAPSPILYVEDEEDDVLLVGLAFKQAEIGHPLVVAENGLEALDYLFATGRFSERVGHPLPCLVLLDLNLPQMGGFEVLHRIREHEATKDLPVVIFSSSTHQGDKQRARELGANDYVVKPSSRALLADFARELKQSWQLR